MPKIIIQEIHESSSSDINIKNEPFRLFGRMIPCYQNGKWSYSVVKTEESWDRFPDENYNYETLAKDHVFFGAYDGTDCVALAIFRHQWNKYFYLHDLKVNSAYKGQHIASNLINEGFKYAQEHGYRGIWTIGQDNNLAACLFYVNNGFRIGGIDTDVYIGTGLEGSSDIYFYKDE